MDIKRKSLLINRLISFIGNRYILKHLKSSNLKLTWWISLFLVTTNAYHLPLPPGAKAAILSVCVALAFFHLLHYSEEAKNWGKSSLMSVIFHVIFLVNHHFLLNAAHPRATITSRGVAGHEVLGGGILVFLYPIVLFLKGLDHNKDINLASFMPFGIA